MSRFFSIALLIALYKPMPAGNINSNNFVARLKTTGTPSVDDVAEKHHTLLLPQFPLPQQMPYADFCPGSTLAAIYAPLGYNSYQWFTGSPPIAISPANGGNTPTLTINNPIAGTIYTLQLVTAGGATFVAVDTLQYSFVSINGTGSNSSCVGGTSGSGTVLAGGSATGYNYAWYGPSGPAVISTNSVLTNIAVGVYTVGVSAIGSAGCGSAVTTVTVGQAPVSFTVVKLFCGTTAYLSTPPLSSNIQWYNNNTLIPSNQGGTAPGFTAVSVSNGSVFRVRYQTPQGCQDSVTMLLGLTAAGSFSVSYTQPACQGASNGLAVLSLTPASAAPNISSFSVFNLPGPGTFSLSPVPNPGNTFTLNNLPYNGTYSINAFDGACAYSTTFAVSSFTFNFSLSSSSITVCPGGSALAGVTFTSPVTPAQYSYSWSPATFIGGGLNQIAVLITPTTVPINTSSTIIYTVVVTPSLVNCPGTKTVAVTSINIAAPTISAIPVFCQNGPAYAVSVNPSGGTFINGPSGPAINPQTGILTPSLASTGVNSFSYSLLAGTCADVGSSFTINAIPSLTVSGSTVICQGQTTTLTVSGANAHTWLNTPPGNQLIVAPAVSNMYTVTGNFSSTGCSSSKTVSVSVNSNPILAVTGNTFICLGQSALLSVSGANTYSWSNGITAAQVSLTPVSTINYNVTGNYTATGCAAVKNVTITVNPNPTLIISTNTAICKGQSTLINFSGASSYSLNTIGSAVSPVTISPTSSTVYSITGTVLSTGCSSTQTILVTVNNNPTLSVSANTTICNGLSATLNASGALYYYWNNTSSPASPIYLVSPTVSTAYMVAGTDANGCTSTKIIAVTVTPCTGLEASAKNGSNAKLYPNPGSGFITIELEEPAMVSVFDELGKLILEKESGDAKNTLDVSTFSNGLYFVKIRDDKSQRIFKLVKQSN